MRRALVSATWVVALLGSPALPATAQQTDAKGGDESDATRSSATKVDANSDGAADKLSLPPTLIATSEAAVEPAAIALLPAGALVYARLNPRRLKTFADHTKLLDNAEMGTVSELLDTLAGVMPDGKLSLETLGLRPGAPVWIAIGQIGKGDQKSLNAHINALASGAFSKGKLKKELADLEGEKKVSRYNELGPFPAVRHTLVIPSVGTGAFVKALEESKAENAIFNDFKDRAGSVAALAEMGVAAADAGFIFDKALRLAKAKRNLGIFIKDMAAVFLIETETDTIVHVAHRIGDLGSLTAVLTALTASFTPATLPWGDEADGAGIILGDGMQAEVLGAYIAVDQAMTEAARTYDAITLTKKLSAAGKKERAGLLKAHKKAAKKCNALFKAKGIIKDLALAVRHGTNGLQLELAFGVGNKELDRWGHVVPAEKIDYTNIVSGAVVALSMQVAYDRFKKAVKVPKPFKKIENLAATLAPCPEAQAAVATVALLPALAVAAMTEGTKQAKLKAVPESVTLSLSLNEDATKLPHLLAILGFAKAKKSGQFLKAVEKATKIKGQKGKPVEVGGKPHDLTVYGAPGLQIQVASQKKGRTLWATGDWSSFATLDSAVGKSSPFDALGFWLLIHFGRLEAALDGFATMSGGMTNIAKGMLASQGNRLTGIGQRAALIGEQRGGALVLKATLW